MGQQPPEDRPQATPQGEQSPQDQPQDRPQAASQGEQSPQDQPQEGAWVRPGPPAQPGYEQPGYPQPEYPQPGQPVYPGQSGYPGTQSGYPGTGLPTHLPAGQQWGQPEQPWGQPGYPQPGQPAYPQTGQPEQPWGQPAYSQPEQPWGQQAYPQPEQPWGQPGQPGQPAYPQAGQPEQPWGPPPASSSRPSTGLVAGIAAALVLVLALVGTGIWYVLSNRGDEPQVSSGTAPSAPATPSAPGQGGSPSGPTAPGASPSGPVSVAAATAALADYDRRNAAAIAASTLAGWKGVDGGVILEQDTWYTTGTLAATKRGVTVPAAPVPTTRLLALLGSGSGSDGSTWFAATNTFGAGPNAGTYVSVYTRPAGSSSYLLTWQATSIHSVPPGAGPDTVLPVRPAAVVKYLETRATQPGLATSALVAGMLFAARPGEKGVSYACRDRAETAATVRQTADGGLTLLTLRCTRSVTAKAKGTLTRNRVDTWTTGDSKPVKRLDCPLAMTIGLLQRERDVVLVAASNELQTATCKATR